MREIVFIRHAKVDMDISTPIPSKMLKSWEEAYNDAPIVQELPKDENFYQNINEVDYVLCSTLRRSIDSVKLLQLEIDETSGLFNEATIPSLKGSWLKLKPTHWLVLFRMLSLLGVGRWAKTYKETKEDAGAATQRLLELSRSHKKIILMGHGVMNWLIRKELVKLGWHKEGVDAHGNWGMTRLTSD